MWGCMDRVKCFSLLLFLLIVVPLFGMQKSDDMNNNDESWEIVNTKAVVKKSAEQLQKEEVKRRHAAAYAKKQAWLERQEIIRKSKQKREKIEKAVLKAIDRDVIDDEKNNIIIIQDHANHQKIYLLKREQEIAVEDFEEVDRFDYLIGEKLVGKNVFHNKAVKEDWNHNFNPLVKRYLKYGEPHTVDKDGCHQYVIVGAIADNEEQLFDYGEFEYGVKEDQNREKICYHRCFRTHDCRYLTQQDQEKLEAYYLKKLQKPEQENAHNMSDEPDDGKNDNNTDDSEKE